MLWRGGYASPGESSGSGLFFRVWTVEGLAVLAAVDFSILAVFLLHFLPKKVPSLEVAGAELALLVLLIAGAHFQKTPLYFGAVG